MLILGCGYLGTHIAKLAADQNFRIDALTRNQATCAHLGTLSVNQALGFELADPSWHDLINPQDYQAIVLCVGSAESTPEGYRKSYIQGIESVLDWVGERFGGKLLYTSSISVYGDAQGAWVDESTMPAPTNWRGEIILESERLLRKALPEQSYIFRLGGIYGPDRNRFLSPATKPDPKSSEGYLNLIHVEDAAAALLAAILHPSTGNRLYNLTDNHPVKRSEIHAFIQSRHLPGGAKPKQEKPSSHRSNAANRRIDSSRIQHDLDWKPAYPSVFEAIPHMV